jgi:hypothetical protein
MSDHARGEKQRSAIVTSNQRRDHLSRTRHVLSTIEYAGKDEEIVRRLNALILGGTELIGGK